MKLQNQILLLISLSLVAHAVHADVDPSLAEVCKQTPDPKLCEDTIAAKLKPGEKVTPMTALMTEIEALSGEAKQAQQDADRAKSTDPALGKIYQECSELFADSQDDLAEASDALKGSDLGTARSELSAVLTDFSTCDDAFEEAGKSSPIAATTARLEKLASICLAIAAKLAA